MSRVLLADDHPLFRQALRAAVVLAQPQFTIEEAGTLEMARAALAREQDFVLVLLDLKMPDCVGFSGLLSLRSEFPQVPVVVVSSSESATTVSRAMAFGAAGFIPKSASINEIGQALVTVLAGDLWTPPATPAAAVPEVVDTIASLTPAQLRTLMGLQRGLLNKQIAFEMGVTEATVKAHITTMFRKLGVVNRTQALIVAQNFVLENETLR